MSVTYSKGPWEADQGCVWDADGKDVATCGELAQWSGDCFHPFDNASANARLIAAAPDLLEALEGLLKIAKLYVESGDPQARAIKRHDFGGDINHALRIISTARGELK